MQWAAGGRGAVLGTGCARAAWSPDGRQIAFSARNSNGYYDLYIVDVDNRGNPTGKPRPLTTTPSISESGPVWVY